MASTVQYTSQIDAVLVKDKDVSYIDDKVVVARAHISYDRKKRKQI